jgi:hypothetical protein
MRHDDFIVYVLMRGAERILIVTAGIVAILRGAQLFKWGVFDKFETVYQHGDRKFWLANTAPGTVYALAGLALCGLGFFFHGDFDQEWSRAAPGPGAAPAGGAAGPAAGEGGKGVLGEHEKTGLTGYGGGDVEFLQLYADELGGEMPSDAADAPAGAKERERRRDIARYLNKLVTSQLADLEELEEASSAERDAFLRSRIDRAMKLQQFFGEAEGAKTPAAYKALAAKGRELSVTLKESKP